MRGIVEIVETLGLWINLAIIAPTLIALIWPAFRFATALRQLFANLSWGLVFIVISMSAVQVGFDPIPNSWADRHFALFVIGIAPFGALLGVATAVAVRRIAKAATATHTSQS